MNKLLLLLAFLWSFKHFAQTSDFKHVNFEKADNIAKQFEGASLENLPVLVHQLTSGLNTDVEKFRAVYFWVCSNIANDYGNHIQNLKKRKKFKNDSLALYNWNDEFKDKALKKLIKHKKTICTGYAYLLQELAVLAGLNCKMIHGYGRTVSANIGELSIPNHSWNVVKLKNKWYLSDPTWASGFFHFDEGKFIAKYNDGYFLSDPELFVRSHYPLDNKWLLTKNNVTVEDFLTGPLIYGNTFKYKIAPLSPTKMEVEVAQKNKLTFQFEIPKHFNKNDVSLVVGNTSKSNIKTYAFNSEKDILEIERTFKSRGFYDVHLKIGEDVVTTYRVKVVKNKD